MAALAALLGTACQRELTAEPAAGAAPQENLTPRIAAFVALAEHAASSNGPNRDAVTYTTDSAAWYVEGALNYSLAQPWLSFNELVTDSINLTIAANNGTVAATDAQNAYVQLAATINNVIQNRGGHIVVVDVLPARNAGANEGSEWKAVFVTGIGNDRLYNLNTTYPSYTSLMWITQQSNSSCDPNHPDPNGADKTIKARVAATIPHLAVGQYYASVETWHVSPINGTDLSGHQLDFSNFTNPNNNSGHSNQNYLIYSCDGTANCSYCLDAGDMSFHTQGTYNVMQWIKTNQCPTKTPASIDIVANLALGGWSYYFHEAHFTYGIPQYKKGPQ